ncbi:hypothetical protein POJ06DRAFT_257733 [Lipomyces tetrasporus]|uniref:F-box domain-containing protein n=1 Tax=Lipomyces tetrasporus TaxID=54092 RepID=A0AAD7VRA8_9ASCO|nr:uncharacterized protein POJ06DRAFT_257733 [Lipomyces tetrasporus]KAJ8098696.1 hypothetical protein POJ06DRAFT_257733 [Lipomyces tetrasporus]
MPSDKADATTTTTATAATATDKQQRCYILELPGELLEYILGLVHSDDTGIGGVRTHLTRRLALFKKNVLPVCHRFHDVGLKALYSHVHIGHPRAFDVFRYELRRNPALGPAVRCLDFSDFTSVGLGRTRRMNREIQMVTATTITDALSQTPNLREFLVSESVEDDIGKSVLDTLFALPYLEAIDFCGASSSTFTHSFSTVQLTIPLSNLTRVSLHECVSLPPSVFEKLLPQVDNLRRLDLSHTQVSGAALDAIPHTARLTHLSLAKCRSLAGKDILKFLTAHPAIVAGDQLRWLSLQWTDVSAEQLTSLLRDLPSSVMHLNLYGLPVEDSHLSLLPSGLEELSLGYADLEPDTIIDHFGTPKRPNLHYLDLTGNPHMNVWTIGDMRLLRSCSDVRTWEFDAQQVLAKMADAYIPGYTIVLGQGRRGWIFKGHSALDGAHNCSYTASPHSTATYYPTASAPSCCQHVLGMDMGNSDAWAGASRKIDCSGEEYGGGLERGIYLYYAYRTK